MLDTFMFKYMDRQSCLDYKETYNGWLELTNRRIERIRSKQAANPDFKAYDKWADDFVDIDTRLEEQLAIADELASDMKGLNNRLDVLNLQAEHPKAKVISATVAQLSLFEAVAL